MAGRPLTIKIIHDGKKTHNRRIIYSKEHKLRVVLFSIKFFKYEMMKKMQ